MKNLVYYFLIRKIAFILILISANISNAQVFCSSATPFFEVDLSADPNATWLSPAVTRNGECCGGGTDQVNCIEFAIILHPNATGINFAVASGANPGGALFYQVNCNGVPVSSGFDPVVCLDGAGPHYISYCKTGNNINEYSISSVPGPFVSDNIVTAEGCSQDLSISGATAGSAVWNSISPGSYGQYNNLLSNQAQTVNGTSGVPFSGFEDVLVTPILGSPSTVQYEVCATALGSCSNTSFCDTVSVTVVPEMSVDITPAPPYLCFGQPFETLTANVTGGLAPYSYLWSNGETTASINVTSLGTYSVTVTDATGCASAFDQTTVIEFVNPITADAGPDLTVCEAISSNIQINGSVTGVTTGIWSGGSGTYSTSTTDLSLEYTLSPAEILAGSVTLTLTTTNNGTCPGDSDQVTITVSEMTATVASSQNVSCFGGASGSALINGNGGVAPYTYSLNGAPGVSTNLFNGLTAGAYTVVVSDAVGCSAQVAFTITQPTQLTFVSVPQHVSCFGLCDGQITVNASGGTLPYTYSGNNGTTFNTSNIINNLCAGITGVVVQDAAGCLTNLNVNITQPTQLTATYTVTNPICNNDCNGQVTVNASGGTPAYQYSLNGAALQGSSSLTGLCAGNNTILLQDGNGCQVTSVQNLTNPPAFEIDTLYTLPSFCGFNNGSIEVIADGLNGPFTYSIDGGPQQPTGEYTNLYAGAYSFVATDALGCQAQGFFGVNDVEMDGIIIDISDVLCFGGSDGLVEVTNSSGIDPITFEIDNNGLPQASGVFLNVNPGSHIITITDNGACVFTLPFTINEPEEIQYTVSSSEVSCFGGSDGTITITNVTGGVGTYEYSMDGFVYQASPTFGGLTVGLYDVYVRDTNNCVISVPIEVFEPTPVDFDFSVIDLTCFNNNSGVIQLSGIGGNGGYTYSINNGSSFQTSSTFFGLPAGSYDIVVQDITGCTASAPIVINEPPLLTSLYSSLPVSCFGTCDGEISFVANGGTSDYMYSIDAGITYSLNPDISGLCAGTYNLQVIDDNGCSITNSINVGSPTQVQVSGVSSPSTCGSANGEIIATAVGGTPGYTYSIDNIVYDVNNVYNGLDANSYTIHALDGNNCPASTIVIVAAELSPVITGTLSSNASCFDVCDGEIIISSSGGTGIVQYSIGGPYQVSNTFSGLCDGLYDLSIIDANGCVTNAASQIEITEPTLVSISTDFSDLLCFENGTGIIEVTASGGTPDYLYSNDNGATYQLDSAFYFLEALTYDIIVQDANGCEAVAQVTLGQPPLMEINNVDVVDALCFSYCDGSAQAFASGGTINLDYNYYWYQDTASIGVNVNPLSNLCADEYNLVIVDENGCWDTTTFQINEPLPMVIDNIQFTDPLCYQSCDGTIEVFSSTAVQYSFDGGQNYSSSSTAIGLCEGNYYIAVQDSDGCLAYDSTTVVLVDPDLLTVQAGPNDTICSGTFVDIFAQAYGGVGNYVYHWNNGNNSQIQSVSPGFPNGTYVVSVEDGNGCVSESDTTLIQVYDILAISVSNDTIVCPGSEVVLNSIVDIGEPNYSYSWSTGGNNISSDSSTLVSPNETTSYIIEISDFCTTLIDTVIVNTFYTPEVTFAATEKNGCTPMTVTVEPTIDVSIFSGNCQWTVSDGTQFTGCGGFTETYDEIGCYEVTFTGTSIYGCELTGFGQDVFCVRPYPIADFFYDPDEPNFIESFIEFTNISDGADLADWTFSGYGTSTEINPRLFLGNSDTGDSIYVCLIASTIYGCADTVCQTMAMVEPYQIYTPNTFTPDGDEYNNTFKPIFPPNYPLDGYSMLIYNRWGEVIFETLDYKYGWDGTYKGELCQDGTYTWKIVVSDGRNGEKYNYVGHVNIIR